ncbi:MAG: hypothetical protein LIO87_03795 [Eubacterium sp.]|nr:hypothetical protein [Eubacterium sp.]
MGEEKNNMDFAKTLIVKKRKSKLHTMKTGIFYQKKRNRTRQRTNSLNCSRSGFGHYGIEDT